MIWWHQSCDWATPSWHMHESKIIPKDQRAQQTFCGCAWRTRTPSTTTIMVPKHASAIQAFLDLSDLLKLKKGTLSLFQDDISRCTKMTLSLNRQLKISKVAIINTNWISLELPEKCTWVATFIFGNKLTWDVRQKRRLSYPSLFHHVVILVLPVLHLFAHLQSGRKLFTELLAQAATGKQQQILRRSRKSMWFHVFYIFPKPGGFIHVGPTSPPLKEDGLLASIKKELEQWTTFQNIVENGFWSSQVVNPLDITGISFKPKQAQGGFSSSPNPRNPSLRQLESLGASGAAALLWLLV